MAILWWLKFRGIFNCRLLCITHKAIYICIYIYIFVGVLEYLSKLVSIRTTTRPISECKLMKLFVPFVSSMYAYAAFTVSAPKYWNSLPDDARTISYVITLKCRLYSYTLSL